MTLIAGIVNRNPDRLVPASASDGLRRSISRSPADNVFTWEGLGYFFVKLDIGAFGEAADIVGENGDITLVCGEPLLDEGETANGRKRDAGRIHDGLVKGDLSVLCAANGVFSASHYERSSGDLMLITDKLGIRPIYYWLGEKCLIFASALRILEELAEVPKVMDVRTVTEMVGLGYALADRSPYADIKMLRPGEALLLNDGVLSSETYWRWDQNPTSTASEEKLLADVYQRFQNAVSRRVGNDKATSAYLSGGLDSRCIVAALRGKGVEVHTYNFARPQTQDLLFGREFANEIGSKHTEVPKESGDMVPDFSQLMADAISASDKAEIMPERPALVWSGEGGSVALGHVHLSEEMVQLMHKGEIDRVIGEYIRRESASVAPRMFRAEVASNLAGILEKGIRDEFGRFQSTDPARNFYFFLLLNDQHRKLSRHFENIDLHRLEFQLPFFDSDFLSAVASLPLDICLRHRFYVSWLSLFPTAVTSVPWQAYPGHEPCPVPVSDDLAYQWADTYQSAERSTQRRRESREAAEMLRSRDFPAAILSRKNLKLAALIHQIGFRNYQYLLGPAHVYYDYWRKCSGRYVLPDQTA